MAQPVTVRPAITLPSGELEVVGDVALAWSERAAAAISDWAAGNGAAAGDGSTAGYGAFRLGISGGSSGSACLEALLGRGDVDFSRVEWFFADERCVPRDDPQSNAGMLLSALARRGLSGSRVHPMDCDEGPQGYETLLRAAGGLDLLQLGFGPDGHTASLFPDSAALAAVAGQLVTVGSDPSGRNRLPRMTLTLEGIALAVSVVIVVAGAEKAGALSRIAAGEALPAARVRARQLAWLIDAAALPG